MLRKKSWLWPVPVSLLLFSAALALCASGFNAQETKQAASETKPAEAQFPEAHFHHMHLNTLDPNGAIDFYTSKFDCEKAKFAGMLDAVWAQKSWLLFGKVEKAPPWELTSAIWHFGWGAEDMKATYEKHVAAGTKFFTPLTDISDIISANTPPEINTASHHRFGHLHLFSAAPVAAGEWYAKYFGAKLRSANREPRLYREHQIGPSASLTMDNVNIIIYPVEYSKKAHPEHWKGKTEIDSTKGRVVDHVGFSVANLPEALEKLRKDGVKVTDEIRSVAGGKIKFAFIEGPDKIRIELVEGHPSKE
jgi:predicted enzyme related to lactoylglutathione lyase